MTTTHTDTTAELISMALADAEQATTKYGEITIYVDPTEGGYAYHSHDEDVDQRASGPIGPDGFAYGDRTDESEEQTGRQLYDASMTAVRQALHGAGYEVAQ